MHPYQTIPLSIDVWEWWPRGYSWKAIGRFKPVVVASQCRLTYPEQLANSRSTALVATWTTVWDIDKLLHPWPLVQTNWDSLVSTLISIDSFLFSTMTSYSDIFSRKCTCYTWLKTDFRLNSWKAYTYAATQTPKLIFILYYDIIQWRVLQVMQLISDWLPGKHTYMWRAHLTGRLTQVWLQPYKAIFYRTRSWPSAEKIYDFPVCTLNASDCTAFSSFSAYEGKLTSINNEKCPHSLNLCLKTHWTRIQIYMAYTWLILSQHISICLHADCQHWH